jgi:tape measure domain-containing protein
MAIDIGAGLGSDVTGMRVTIDPRLAQQGADIVNRAFDTMPDHADKAASRIDQSMRRIRQSVLGLSTAFTSIGIGVFANEVLRADVTMAKIMGTLRTATGGIGMAAVTFTEIKKISRDLAIDLGTAANAFARLQAATRGTATEGKATIELFKGVSAAVTATGGGAYELYLALKAVEQMASKGRIQMEELRGQLGDVLPGAFNDAAKAIGVTTAQLNKMMKAGLGSEDFLNKFGPYLFKKFEAGAKEMSNSIIGVLNRWKTFKLELLSSVAFGGFSESMNKAITKMEGLLNNKEFTTAITNIGKLLGSAVDKVSDAIVYLGNHIQLVRAAFMAFAASKLIDFFMGLAASINAVKEALMGVSAVTAASGLLGPGGAASAAAAAEGGAAGVAKGGLAPLALMFPYLFDKNGKPLSKAAFSTRANSSSFTQNPEGFFYNPSPQAELGMLGLFTGKNGQVLNQSQFNAKSADPIQGMAIHERVRLNQMANALGMNVPFLSMMGVGNKTRAFFSSETSGKSISGKTTSGIIGKLASLFSGSEETVAAKTGGRNLKAALAALQSEKPFDFTNMPGGMDGFLNEWGTNWALTPEKGYVPKKSSLFGQMAGLFTGITGKPGNRSGKTLRDTFLYHGTNLDFTSGILQKGGLEPNEQGVIYLSSKDFAALFAKTEFATNRGFGVQGSPQTTLRVKIPKGTRLFEGTSQPGIEVMSKNMIDSSLLSTAKRHNLMGMGGTLEDWTSPEYMKSHLRQLQPNAPGSIKLTDQLLKDLPLANTILDKNGKLLTQTALNAKLASEGFKEFGTAERIAIKGLAELNGLHVSYGKVLGAVIPDTKKFVSFISSKETWTAALTGISNFGSKGTTAVRNMAIDSVTSLKGLGLKIAGAFNWSSITAGSKVAFEALKSGGSKAWDAMKSGVALIGSGLVNVVSKIGSVGKALWGLVVANPLLAIAAAIAATYILWDTYKDKIIKVHGETTTIADITHGWLSLAQAEMQGLIDKLDEYAKKLGGIKLPGGGNVGMITNAIMQGLLSTMPGYHAGDVINKEAASAWTTRMAAQAPGFTDPITGNKIPFPDQGGLGIPLVKTQTAKKTAPTTNGANDAIIAAIAALKAEIAADDQIFAAMTKDSSNLLSLSNNSIEALVDRKGAVGKLAAFDVRADKTTGAPGTKYYENSGKGKEFVDLTMEKARKDAVIKSTSSIADMILTMNEELDVQKAVNDAIGQGEYAMEAARTEKQHNIQVAKIMAGLTEDEKNKLLPWIDKLNIARKSVQDLTITEKIRSDAQRNNLNVPGLGLASELAMLKAQQSEGLTPQAYWLAATNAIEQYKQSMDQVLMMTKTWKAGAFVAFRQYAEYAKDAARQTYEFFNTAIHGLEDGLTQLFTGKGFGGLKQAGQNLLESFQRSMVQKYITGPLASKLEDKFGIDLGLNKPDGSRDRPFWTLDKNSAIGSVMNPSNLGGPKGLENNWVTWLFGLFGGKKKKTTEAGLPDLSAGNGISLDDAGFGTLTSVSNKVSTNVSGTMGGLVKDQGKKWDGLINIVGSGFTSLLGSLFSMMSGGKGSWWRTLIGVGIQVAGALAMQKISTGSWTGAGGGGGENSGGSFYGARMAMGGIVTPKGTVSLNRYAMGGIANTPQMAIFGEGRLPEAYVPLPDGRRIPVMMNGAGHSMSVTNYWMFPNADPQMFKESKNQIESRMVASMERAKQKVEGR